MKITKIIREFIEKEQAGGLVLIACTIVSLLISNSPLGEAYQHIWHIDFFSKPVEFWINDGLMAIFFLLVGLELKREIFSGELSNIKSASLPIIGAIGGMAIPALIFLLFNSGTETQHGFGIPMATDIAFAIGILSLLGNRVPIQLKVFLLALAVIDDLGAIIVIALFYSSNVSFAYLGAALAIFAVLMLLNRLNVKLLFIYLIGGIIMWYCMHESGVHATITGVLLAFTIPFDKKSKHSLSIQLEHALHLPVAFVIMPLFALANTSIIMNETWTESFSHVSGLGIMVGLIVGKPVGIFLSCWLAAKLKVASLAKGLSWKYVLGAGCMAGIGFTMSIFVTILAYDDVEIVNHSKIAILLASTISALIGYIFLSFILPKKKLN